MSRLFILLGFIFPLSVFADTITLNKAIDNNWITVNIRGADIPENSGTYISSYTGQCIELEITNLTKNPLKLFLEAGRFLQPDSDWVQRMIITHDQMMIAKTGTPTTIKAYAMCSELMDKAPHDDTQFKLGNKADGNLLELAQLISKNNFQDDAAQTAVWAITDDYEYSDIYSENSSEMKTLRDFVKKAKGITEDSTKDQPFQLMRDDPKTYINYSSGNIKGSFAFELKQDTKLSLTLYKESGEIFHKSVQGYLFKKGNNTLTYTFTYKNVPEGNYTLKLTDEAGNALLNKVLTFK